MKKFGILLMALMFSGLTFADDVATDLQSKVIEKFSTNANSADDPQNHKWHVVGSKFITQGYPMFKTIEASPEALKYNILNDGSIKEPDTKSLGVRGSFIKTGYNFIELYPVSDEQDDKGAPIPQGIPMPGRVKTISMWIWGSGYRYDVTLQVRDYKGYVTTLPVGTINHYGWKEFTVNVPTSIPQDRKYLPKTRNLELVKLTVTTEPNEKVTWSKPGKSGEEERAGFYIYFDHIRVLTDLHENPYDGRDLAEKADELWGDGNNSSDSQSSAPAQQ